MSFINPNLNNRPLNNTTNFGSFNNINSKINQIQNQNQNQILNKTSPINKNLKPNINTNKSPKNKTNKNENHIKRIKKFCRILEKNTNNYIPFKFSGQNNLISKGLYLRIDSINGIKKIIPKEQVAGKNFFIRIFLTFFHNNSTQFFGNTYKSQLLNIKFNDTGHFELNELDPLYVYFLCEANDNKNGINAIMEILFVETNEELRILNQTSEGWGLLEIQESPNGKNGVSTKIYSGSPMILMHKNINGNFIFLKFF
jgi:hypothetical protein